jgi:hypothetical protein
MIAFGATRSVSGISENLERRQAWLILKSRMMFSGKPACFPGLRFGGGFSEPCVKGGGP